MYETTSVVKGVIQPLGNRFGSKDVFAYIGLDKNDHTDTTQAGENTIICRLEMIKLIVFFFMIYRGVKDLQSVSGRIFFKLSNGKRVF